MAHGKHIVSGLIITIGINFFLSTAQALAETASWVPVKLTRIARNVDHDPKGIWPDSDVPRTDILYGEYQSAKPRGTVAISMLIGGVCDSPSECPVRAVFVPKGSTTKQDLADGSDQVCASGDGIELKTDLTALRGCNVPVKFNPIKSAH